MRLRVPLCPLTRDELTSDRPSYVRRPLSNREGFRRLDVALGKLAEQKSARATLCDVCHRRVFATRIVPSVDGHRLPGAAGRFGPALVCCDTGPDSCAARLTRAGVPQQAAAQREAMRRLGLVLP
jgi:hypothetical protein